MIREQEKQQLLSRYASCQVYQGELHDHAHSGGTSDGKCTLEEWISQMQALKMDFAAILDHRQIRHMYLPEWQDGLFIPGTEPGTAISDCHAENNHMHYNILLPHRDKLEKLLMEFPEYEFSGGVEGHFIYPSFTRERFGQLIDAILQRGGFFVHPHPTSVMASEDPLDYWFRDETGMEVIYGTPDSTETIHNYALWLKLLAAGKRIFACAGGDGHAMPSAAALTTLYAREKSSAAFLPILRRGDFTCGGVGIRMCMGETPAGGSCDFTGKRLIVCVSDFHESLRDESHAYRLDILNETGIVHSEKICCTQPHFTALDAESCAFYRAEVTDETKNLRIAIGNPIWSR